MTNSPFLWVMAGVRCAQSSGRVVKKWAEGLYVGAQFIAP